MVRFRLPDGSLCTGLSSMINMALDASYLPPLTRRELLTGIVSVPDDVAGDFYASTKRMGVRPA